MNIIVHEASKGIRWYLEPFSRLADGRDKIMKLALLFPIGLTVCLVSCAPFTSYPDRATSPDSDLQALSPHIGADQIIVCLTGNSVASNLDAKRTVDPFVSEETCRNRLISARVYATDIQFSQFEERLFRQTREVGFATTVATLGLNAAASLAGQGTSQILSAIAGGLTGSRAAFEREVLGERTLLAIQAAMRSNRTLVLARIRRGLTQSTFNYPLGAGLTDTEDYYFAGTVLGALIGITDAVGVQASKADQSLVEATGLSSASASVKIREYLNAPGLSHQQQIGRIREVEAAAAALGFGDITLGSLDRSQTPEDERKTAAIARKMHLIE